MNHVKFEVSDAIATVTIDRPKALNALNTETLQELNACFREIRSRRDIRVVIVTGGGEKSFVAGADIAEMYRSSASEGRALAKLGDETFRLLEEMPQATIAAVNGYALGGGCELAMACDIRIASEKARFGQPEVGLGVIPGFGGTQRLARLVGRGRAKELIFTCAVIDAQEACRIGLVNHVVPAEALMDECRAMAETIRSKSGYAVSLAKDLIDRGMETDREGGLSMEAVSLGLSFASPDKAEGMAAFLEKRPAKFTEF